MCEYIGGFLYGVAVGCEDAACEGVDACPVAEGEGLFIFGIVVEIGCQDRCKDFFDH